MQLSLSDIEAKEAEGEDTIVQAYTALLLTCLVAHVPKHIAELTRLLPAGGINLLCVTVSNFLRFSGHVGMVSVQSQEMLLGQLKLLQQAVDK